MKRLLKKFSKEQLKKIDLRTSTRYEPYEWRKINSHILFRLLKAEVEELHEEIERGDTKRIKEEALDIANFAFFIWEKHEKENN